MFMYRIKKIKEKISFYQVISFILRFSIVIAIVTATYHKDWLLLFSASIIFILTFAPMIIERNFKIFLPTELEIIMVIFIYLSLFLGEIKNYYLKYWWWDIMLHGFSAMIFGLCGFIILFVMYQEKKIKAKPIFIAIFAFCFALAIGALWEIFEFTMDQAFDYNMQKSMLGDDSGLTDTMFDLIIDSIGAFFAAVLAYFYIKNGRTYMFNNLLNNFIAENRHLFNKLNLSNFLFK
jgi:uncharacterized membrane protein YjdF